MAYNLNTQRRATLVGETTGGAHPVESFRPSDVLEPHLPVARSVNAVTGTNSEQLGVIPDVARPAAGAMDVTLRDLAAA